MKAKTNLFNVLSVVSFVLYFITLFPIWFDASIKWISGSLVLSRHFPLSEIFIAVFAVCSILSFVKSKAAYSWIALIALILQGVLTIELILWWHGLTFITVWFYISFSFLVISVIFMVIDAEKKMKSKSAFIAESNDGFIGNPNALPN